MSIWQYNIYVVITADYIFMNIAHISVWVAIHAANEEKFSVNFQLDNIVFSVVFLFYFYNFNEFPPHQYNVELTSSLNVSFLKNAQLNFWRLSRCYVYRYFCEQYFLLKELISNLLNVPLFYIDHYIFQALSELIVIFVI